MSVSKDGLRKRYISFEVESERALRREDMERAIGRKASVVLDSLEGIKKPWLTVFNGRQGIVRCAHVDQKQMIELLSSITYVGKNKIPVTVRTLKTSGTIKQVKKTIASSKKP